MLGLLAAIGCAGGLELLPGNVLLSGDGQVQTFLAAREEDAAVDVLDDALEISVETRTADGDWWAASDTSVFDEPVPADVVLVLDNSASVQGDLDAVVDAFRAFATATLAEPGRRVGLVRVSTEAQVLVPLTGDPDVITAALDALYVTNGWTALWDGVRLANEVLEAGNPKPRRYKPSIVVFSKGDDTNSADENGSGFTSDGIDTTADDLAALEAGGVSTRVHSLDLRWSPERGDPLAAIATTNGGIHAPLEAVTELPDALDQVRALRATERALRFRPAHCEDTEARVTVVRGEDAYTTDFAIPDPC